LLEIANAAPPLTPPQMREERPNLERGDSPGVYSLGHDMTERGGS